MLYVAYGSNLNKDQMKFRVPNAKPYGKGIVYNWQLAFHGKDGMAYATLLQAPGKNVPVVLWEMSDKEEAVMDRYEGFPNSYYKKKIPVHVDGKKLEGIVYIMNTERRVGRPSRKYVNTIRCGYEAFGLDVSYLTDALERNSRDYYLDDLLEVREFKTFVSRPVKKKTGKKSKVKKKSVKNTEFKWRTSGNDSGIPVSLGDYMCKSFPEDPYWRPTYGREDDDVYYEYLLGTKKPSLDDYDCGYGGNGL